MGRKREAGADLWSPRCLVCNRYLVRTTSGYMACSAGHGGLRIDLEAIPEADDYTLAMFPDAVDSEM